MKKTRHVFFFLNIKQNLYFQTREFLNTRTLLFDGESALRSKTVQREIFDKLNIKIHAQAFWKRAMAERAIKEVKLRMAIRLDLEGRSAPPLPYLLC